MKTLLLVLCGCLLVTAMCRAQQPAAGEPRALLLVYVSNWGAGTGPTGPRIALGLEQPVLKVASFETCALVYEAAREPNIVAVQFKAADTQALAEVLKAKDPDDSSRSRHKILWLFTPNNKLLGTVDSNNISDDFSRSGVLGFSSESEKTIFAYLKSKLDPK